MIDRRAFVVALFWAAACGAPTTPAPAAVRCVRVAIDFGAIGLGKSAIQSVQVINDGDESTGPLAVRFGGADPDAYALDGDGCSSLRLPGRGSCTVVVRFSPAQFGPRSASLEVNGTPGGLAVAKLDATGATPAALTVSPPSADFGTREIVTGLAGSVSVPFTIGNGGGLASGGISLSLTGPDVTSFQVQGSTCAAALQPGEICSPLVGFLPATAGPKHANLVVAAAPGGTVTVPLTGVGAHFVTFGISLVGLGGSPVGGVMSDLNFNCATSQCQFLVPLGTTIKLTAFKGPHNSFQGWQNACAGVAGSVCSVVVDHDPTGVEADFLGDPTTLTVTTAAVGGAVAHVTSVPAGISCGTASCSADFPFGTVVELDSDPPAGSYFNSWSGDCTGTPPTCAVIMGAPRAVGAKFSPANTVFVTSTTYAGGSLGGLTGADAACTARAMAAGLSGTFFAFLPSSTSTLLRDPTSRLSGASGWVTPAGLPVFADLNGLRSELNLHPPRTTELGSDVTATGSSLVMTGTDATNLYLAGEDCADWTSSSGTVTAGDATGGRGMWHLYGAPSSCATPMHLYCFEADYSVTLPASAAPSASLARLAFVTSNRFVPRAGGGIADADAACTAEAQALGVGGPFLALLATSTSSAESRFTTPRPWFRQDGIAIVSQQSELLASPPRLIAPIEVGALPSVRSSNVAVLAGAADPSTPGTPASTCNDWSSPTSITPATTGLSNATDARFFSASTADCSTGAYLFCASSF